MPSEYVVAVIGGLLSLLAVWGGNHISNKPKEEDSSVNKINTILNYYEKVSHDSERRLEKSEKDNKHLEKENEELKQEVRDLKRVIRKLKNNERG